MDQPEFESKQTSPLSDLSEFSLELHNIGPDFSLKCRLSFGTMSLEEDKVTYEVGVTRADLRVHYEGCEKIIGPNLGDAPSHSVEQVTEITTSGSAKGALALVEGSLPSVLGSLEASATAQRTSKVNRRFDTVVSMANGWRIESPAVAGEPEVLFGAVIPDNQLCQVRRKRNSNRLAVVGEIHVSKQNIKVKSTRGNRLKRLINDEKNKDAIVAQIIKKAITRSVPRRSKRANDNTVVLAKCEVEER